MFPLSRRFVVDFSDLKSEDFFDMFRFDQGSADLAEGQSMASAGQHAFRAELYRPSILYTLAERLVSLVALVLAAPVILLIMLAVRIDSLGSGFKCNTHGRQGIGCCDGQTKQAPQQRGTWRDLRRA